MSPQTPHRLPTCRRPRPAAGVPFALAATLLPAAEAVATEAVSVPGVSFATMLQTFAGLALILALFLGAAWFARRLNGGQAFVGGNGPLCVLCTLQVGPRERILLIEVAETWLVVGVIPGQIRTLHTLPKGELPAAGIPGEGQFAHWLRQLRENQNRIKD